MLPSPLDFPPLGTEANTRLANLLNGKDCIYTFPGPCNLAKNKPSPPKIEFLIPPTNSIS